MFPLIVPRFVHLVTMTLGYVLGLNTKLWFMVPLEYSTAIF